LSFQFPYQISFRELNRRAVEGWLRWLSFQGCTEYTRPSFRTRNIQGGLGHRVRGSDGHRDTGSQGHSATDSEYTPQETQAHRDTGSQTHRVRWTQGHRHTVPQVGSTLHRKHRLTGTEISPPPMCFAMILPPGGTIDPPFQS